MSCGSFLPTCVCLVYIITRPFWRCSQEPNSWAHFEQGYLNGMYQSSSDESSSHGSSKRTEHRALVSRGDEQERSRAAFKEMWGLSGKEKYLQSRILCANWTTQWTSKASSLSGSWRNCKYLTQKDHQILAWKANIFPNTVSLLSVQVNIERISFHLRKSNIHGLYNHMFICQWDCIVEVQQKNPHTSCKECSFRP